MKLLSKLSINTKDDFIAFIRQTFKYGIVGATSTLVSLAIYYSLLWLNKNWYIFAYTVCFAIGVLVSYYLNNKFVFNKTEKGHKKALIKAYISYSITYLISAAAIYVMVEFMSISSGIAPLLNVFVTVPINYLLMKFWTFK